ncbi:MAG: hypothetical protein R3C26_13305 [Calditrichia bacterium]
MSRAPKKLAILVVGDLRRVSTVLSVLPPFAPFWKVWKLLVLWMI